MVDTLRLEERICRNSAESIFKNQDGSTDGQGQADLGGCIHKTNREDWNLAKRVIDQSKVKWAINTFKPLKSAGTNEIVPALLQHSVGHLVASHLCYIFRACLAYGYHPRASRD
jgi:hypothetical protein